MTKVVSFNDDSENSEDEIELGQGALMAKVNKGTINQGLGPFIGASGFNQPPTKHSGNSFIDIVPAMFDGSPKRNRDDDEMSKILLRQLETKNAALEETKFNLEEQLRKTEWEKKRFEVSFNNLDKLLAEKEKEISKIHNEK